MSAQKRHRLVWGTGLGLLAAVGLVVAGPVMSANAADHPNSLADAKKATKINEWQNSDGITSAKDQDWYRYDLPAASTVMVTLGSLPADYSLALYDHAGAKVASSAHQGREFERITTKLAKGRYYVKVYSSKAKSKTNYRMRLRVLPKSVFTLDSRTTILGGTPSGPGVPVGSTATFFNNTEQWQALKLWKVATFDARGKELDTVHGVYTDDQTAGLVRIAPGGSTSVSAGWNTAPVGTVKIVPTPVTEPVDSPTASGLSVGLDPKVPVRRDDTGTYYPLLVTNRTSEALQFVAQVRHYTTIGDLEAQSYGAGTVAPGATVQTVVQFSTKNVPNVARLSVWRGTGR